MNFNIFAFNNRHICIGCVWITLTNLTYIIKLAIVFKHVLLTSKAIHDGRPQDGVGGGGRASVPYIRLQREVA